MGVPTAIFLLDCRAARSATTALWRWSRREHAAPARLGRAHAPISLDRADDDPRHWDLSFISKCWLNTSVRLFFIERSLDMLPLVFI